MPQVAAELHLRPPFKCIMRINEALQAGLFPNCTTLSRSIEVEPRTIKRDVDFMKFRLSFLIEYECQRYGYQ